mgnify:CR=1 FL=1
MDDPRIVWQLALGVLLNGAAAFFASWSAMRAGMARLEERVANLLRWQEDHERRLRALEGGE